MANVTDNRNNTNWLLTVTAMSQTTITATMAGAKGFNDVTGGGNGTGVVDNNGQYNVDLPALAQGGANVVVFTRH